VRVVGVVGRDRNGRELVERLERDGIDVSLVESVPGWTTPTKTRVMGGEPGRTRQHVLRIDREPDGPPPEAVRRELGEQLALLAGQVDALLLSDYGYGLLGDELGDPARAVKAAGAAVVLDPRRTFEPFRGLTAVTPNLGELALCARASGEELVSAGDVARAAEAALERCASDMLLVTLGNRGMSLFSRGGAPPATVAAAEHEAVDVSGAGDTAAAAFTLGLAAGLDGARAMRLANAAAGVVVLEQGATACALDKLRSALATAPEVAPRPVDGEPVAT
jgi:rfaE bifunctional protein kinase chain/domain